MATTTKKEKVIDVNAELGELKKAKQAEEKRNKELEKIMKAEKAETKATIDALQKQLEETQKMIQSLSMGALQVSDTPTETTEEVLYPVVNMFIGELTLLGGEIEFHNYGDIIDLPKYIIREMVQKHRKFARKGYFYICDNELVKELRLENYYKKMLTATEIDEFFDLDINDMERMYNKAPDGQKELIIDRALNAEDNNITIDTDKLLLLSRLSKKQLLEI